MRTKTAAILEKIKSNHNNLGRKVYTGWLSEKPHVGEQVYMETYEEGGLLTTPVITMRFISESEVEFDTRNSVYRLTYIQEDIEEFYITPLETSILSVFTQNRITNNLAVIYTLKELINKLIGNKYA